MNRRGFLAALGAGAVAGCNGLARRSPSRSQTRTSHPFHVPPEPSDWPAPNYNSRHTRCAPARTGAELTEHWHHRISLTERPATVPVAADGIVYYAFKRRAAHEADRVTRLVALDATTGRKRWQHTFGTWNGSFAPPHGPLPVVHGPMIYFGPDSGAETLEAFAAANGTPQWATPSRGGQRLAVPAAGLLHVIRREADQSTPTSTLAALDPLSGATIWRTAFDSRIPGYPSFDGDNLYYPLSADRETQSDHIAVLDPTTGTRQRRFERSVQSFAPVHDGHLYTAQWGSDRIAAIDTGTGNVSWRTDVTFHHDMDDGEVVNARYRFGGVTSERLVVLQHLHGYLSDELRAYDPATGDVVWRVRPHAKSDRVVAFNQPIVVGSTVYATGTYDPKTDAREGFLRRFDITSGDQLAARTLSSPCFVPPIVAGDRVVLVCWDGVHALDYG